jgi:hypothetical protein
MTHHAYYIEGPLSLFAAYKDALKPLWASSYERFGIEEARELIAAASLKSIGDTTYLLAAASITSEAQQALLKLFEEPQRGTTFILLTPHGALLATLKSRMLAYPQKLAIQGSSAAAKKFLKQGAKDRSAAIAALLKDEEGVRERVRDFLNELEAELYTRMEDTDTRVALCDLAQVRSYVGDRSPSLKMLLEHLALSLPTV